jgi:tyrosine-protein kinase Etk/Wzc
MQETPTPPGHNALEQGINPLIVFDILFTRRWFIAAATAAGLAGGWVYGKLATPLYEANTLIQIEDANSGGGLPLGKVDNLMEARSSAAAEMEILRSRMVVGQAVENLMLVLDVQPREKASILSSLLGAPNIPVAEPLRIAAFDVPDSSAGKTFILRATVQGVSLLSPDGIVLGAGRPGESIYFKMDGAPARLLVAESHARPGDEFTLTRISRLSATQALQGALQIEEQGRGTGVLRISLQGADPVRIARVVNEVSTLFVRQNIERKSVEVAKSLDFLDKQLPALRRTLEESESRFNRFRKQAGVFELGAEAQDILARTSALQVELTEMRKQRADLAGEVTEEHPGMRRLDQNIRSVQAELDRLGAKAQTLPNTEQDLLRLTREVKVNAELYSSVLNNYQTLRLAKESRVGNVRILDAAALPEVPIKPKRLQITTVAGAAGLLLGFAAALVSRIMRRGVESPLDIENRTGLQVLAAIPLSPRQDELDGMLKSSNQGTLVLARTAPNDPAVESLRSLRTAIHHALRVEAGNIMLFTGPMPGVGKTFTCINLAAVLGAAGKRVLLIDADIRRGHIHRYFRVKRTPGLAEVLDGTATPAGAVIPGVVHNVDLLSTGALPPHPADLFVADAMGKLLKEFSRQYDLVLVDSSPLLCASETALLAAQADSIFLVVRAEQTGVAEIEACRKQLGHSGTAVTGVIFNAVDLRKRRYRYAYAYAYAPYGKQNGPSTAP